VTPSPETPDEPALDSAPAQPGKYKPTKIRLTVWIILIAVGVYLVVSGLVGILVKGQ
jgi:hypothetical protein